MYEDILYLEAAGNYVNFVLKDKTILSRSTFNEAINQLPADKFIRIHRSYLVSVNKVDKMEKHQLTINKDRIPVGEAYSQNLSAIVNK